MYLLENPFTYPYNDWQLKKDNPQVSFPKPLTDSARASCGMLPVVEIAKPAYDTYTQVCEEFPPVFVEANSQWEQSWAVRGMTETELNTALNNAKDPKRNEIRTAFEAVENSPVEVNTVFWNGGYESAQKLDGAKRMAEMLSQTSVTFYDVDNIGHTLTILEAEVIITTIGMDYQTKFTNKQTKMVAIDNATTLEELDGIVW